MNDGLWKRRAVIVLALIFLFTGCFAHLKAPEINSEMAGFQGMEWDTPLEKVEVQVKVKKKGEDKSRNLKWSSPNNKIFLQNVPLNEVTYVFEKDKFIAVTGVIKGKEDCQKIKDFLVKRLGKPNQVKGDACTWTLTYTLVLFSYNPNKQVAVLIFRKKE